MNVYTEDTRDRHVGKDAGRGCNRFALGGNKKFQ